MIRSTLLALAVLASPVLGQSTLVVDDDGTGTYPDVQSAIDAASPGDVVIVHPGSYGPFMIDGKDVVVHAATETPPVVLGPVVVRNVGVAQQVTLRGLVINEIEVPLTSGPPVPSPPVLGVEACAGAVWIEDVATNPSPSQLPQRSSTGVRVSDSDSVVFASCELVSRYLGFFLLTSSGPLDGLLAIDSTVFLYDSSVTGGVGFGVLTPESRPGLRVVGGEVLVSGSQVFGADGAQGGDQPTCEFCHGLDGGTALVVRSQGAVTLIDSGLFGGAAGPPDDPTTGFCQTTACQAGQPGVGSFVERGSSVASVAGPARTHTASSPVRSGETIVDRFTGEPGDLVFLAFGFSQVPAATGPDLVGAGFVGPPFFFTKVGVLDAAGELELSVPNVGLLDPGFEGVPIWQQGVVVSPALEFWISSPSLLLLLNPPF